MAQLGQWILLSGDSLFPSRSWPWVISRDVAFYFRGHPDYLLPDMSDIYLSKETGPLGFLVTAASLEYLQQETSKHFAAKGLERLSLDDFRRDYRLFLDDHYLTGRFAARLAVTLGNLNEPQLNALLESLPATQADFVRDCAQRLHAAPKSQPLLTTIAPALDTYWEKDLKEKIAVSLKKIASQ
jgi:hypothetical protein